MEITKKIILNTNNDKPNSRIIIKQGCIDTITLIVTINDKGGVLELPPGTTAKIRMLKPDKKQVLNDCDVVNNSVHVNITEQMQAAAGDGLCEIILLNGAKTFTTVTFPITIEANVHDDSQIESTPEYNTLINSLIRIEDAMPQAEEAYRIAQEAQEFISDLEERVESGEFKGEKGDKGDRGEKGEKGDRGEKGEKGDPGFSPTISVNTDTGTTYKLDITDINGTFTTPNLKGADGTGAGDMMASVYDPQGKAVDIFGYVDDNVGEVAQELAAHKADYADLKSYIGYTEDDIYGVEADFVNNKFTRLAGAINKTPGADFNTINAFGGRKRCILTDDGVVLAYYNEPGYTETGALTQAITIEGVTYPVGTPVQVMVEQPKFYYKVVPLQLEPITDGIGYHLRKARYYVSDTYKPGFKVHPAFIRNGVVKDKIYLSAYEGSIYDVSAAAYLLADEQVADFNADKLSSIANTKPASGLTQNLTRANTRKLAENRGAGWQQKDVLCASASQMLMMIEYAAFNMQSAIGLGVVNKPSGEGNESELTGATTNLGNSSGMAVGTNGLVSISYRGEENFWGNIWKWIDGLNVYIDPDTRKTDAYWAAEDFSDDTGSAPYKHVGFNLAPNTDGYVSAFGWSEECDFLFLPTETLGNSALPVGDRFYNAQTGWRVTLLGSSWYNGLDAGAFYWGVHHSASSRNRVIGGGAVYVPQAS